MLAAPQSTSVPFIQILPVPGKAICAPVPLDPIRPIRRRRMRRRLAGRPDRLRRGYGGRSPSTTEGNGAYARRGGPSGPPVLLGLPAERALVGAGVQRFPAVPAELCLGGLTGAQPRLDLSRMLIGQRQRTGAGGLFGSRLPR